jgi:hypothetical protein
MIEMVEVGEQVATAHELALVTAGGNPYEVIVYLLYTY